MSLQYDKSLVVSQLQSVGADVSVMAAWRRVYHRAEALARLEKWGEKRLVAEIVPERRAEQDTWMAQIEIYRRGLL